ncbi:MAG: aminopeptidase P family protein [Oscillospiraceae bacterium]
MNNIEKLRSDMPQENYCALITSDINRRYFCGMKSSAGAVLVFPDAAYLLIDFRYFEKAQEKVTVCEVVRSVKFYEQLSDLLKKHKTEKIYIEADTMTVSELSAYTEKLSGYDIDSTSFLSKAITKLRSVKTPSELEKMQKAQDIAEAALANALENVIKEGATELEVARALDFYMLSNGAEEISFETIALSGKNTSVPHGVPSDKKIQKGEFVLMDFGAVFDGYHSDMTRTVCVGEPTAEMREIYNITLEAQKRCLDMLCPGIVCKELDAYARDYITEKGFGEAFGHGLGHSVGLEIHEGPAANTRDTTVLCENVVMTIEPGIYLPEKFGVRIEDCVYISKKGYTNFAHSPKNLLIL